MSLFDVEKLLGELEGVRRTERHGHFPEWRYHGRLVARQLDSGHLVIRIDFDFRRSTDAIGRRYFQCAQSICEAHDGRLPIWCWVTGTQSRTPLKMLGNFSEVQIRATSRNLTSRPESASRIV